MTRKVPTMRPVCSDYVSKPHRGEINGPTVRPVCAHYLATRCPWNLNHFRNKPPCPLVAHSMRPLCAHEAPTRRPFANKKSHAPTRRPVGAPKCTKISDPKTKPKCCFACGLAKEIVAVGAQIGRCADNICAHYVFKQLSNESDGPIGRLQCAHRFWRWKGSGIPSMGPQCVITCPL